MKKKIVALFIATILSVSLVACGGNSTADTKQEKPKIETSVSEKDTKDTDKKDDSKKKETEKEKVEADKKKEEDKKKAETEKESEKKIASVDTKKETAKTGNKDNNTQKPSNSNNNSSKPENKPSNNSNNNKPSTPSQPENKPTPTPTPEPEQPSKPAEKPAEKPSEPEKPAPHVHSYQVVSSTKGDCSHAGTVTKKCNCGDIITETGSYGDHNMVHHPAQGHDVTDYDEHYICNQCGMDFGDDADAAGKHCIVTQGCQNYSLKPVPVGSHWEETSPAYDECSICGKR